MLVEQLNNSRLSTKTSPQGEFEFGKGPSPKGEVLEVNIRYRIRVMVRMLIFLKVHFFEGSKKKLKKS